MRGTLEFYRFSAENVMGAGAARRVYMAFGATVFFNIILTPVFNLKSYPATFYSGRACTFYARLASAAAKLPFLPLACLLAK